MKFLGKLAAAAVGLLLLVYGVQHLNDTAEADVRGVVIRGPLENGATGQLTVEVRPDGSSEGRLVTGGVDLNDCWIGQRYPDCKR